jgi:AAA ATPase domain
MARSTSFVGREEQLGELRESWRAAVRGRGGLVVVSGEAGIGKTRLIEQLAAEVAARGGGTSGGGGGGRVAWGTCAGLDAPPLWPWRAVLRELPGRADAVVGSGASAAFDMVDPAGDQARTFARIVGELRGAAADQPLLVVLDDLHWADPDSLSLLAFIGFVAMVHRRLAATGRSPVAAGTFLVAGTACVTLGLLGSLVEAALVQRIAPGADESAIVAWYGLWDIVTFTGPPLAFTFAMAVAAVVPYRDRTFPRWLAAVAAVSVVLGTITLVADLATDSVVPAAVDLGGFLLANVWIIGLSVVVLLRSRSGAKAPSALDAGVPARPAAV